MFTETCAGATGAQLTTAVAKSDKANAFIAAERETAKTLPLNIVSP
jgi:hypothetical protein